MPSTFDQILPSLQSLGVWSYWIVALVALLEAFVLTGLFVPGSLVILAAGMMVQRGAADFFDMAWFVAIGSALGAQASYRLGRAAARGLERRREAQTSRYRERARVLLGRYGGFAMVLGRFLGPVSGFVAFSAALGEMKPRRFLAWNIGSAAVQALALLALGYFFGDALGRIGAGASRVGLFVGAVVALLVALWFILTRALRAIPLVISLTGSIARAVRDNPEVAGFAQRNPWLAQVIGSRLDPSRFSGLPLTLFSAGLIYLASLFAGLAFDIVTKGSIVGIDERVATLLYAFRDDRLIRFFTAITAVGDKRSLAALVAGLSVALWLARRRYLVAGLVFSALGGAATTALLKTLFARPRPELAYFYEASFSFPSGHATGAVASLAMASYVLWRARWLGPVTAGILAGTLVVLIGLSRIYLIEHYLGDVLGGYLVGALWAVGGIMLAEWLRARRRSDGPVPRPERPRPLVLATILAVSLSLSGWVVVSYSKTRNPPARAAAPQVTTDVAGLFAAGTLPAMSETITGAPQEPVSIVIVVPGETEFIAAMRDAGWTLAEKPGMASLARAAWAAWLNLPDAEAPVTPSFWNAQPNDWGFQKPTQDQTLRQRHHARFWRTAYRTAAGGQIIVGTASFDDGLKWGLTHHIDPNIDAERETLVADLLATGRFGPAEPFQMVAPRLGQNFAGDPWFTDGKAVLLTMTAP